MKEQIRPIQNLGWNSLQAILGEKNLFLFSTDFLFLFLFPVCTVFIQIFLNFIPSFNKTGAQYSPVWVL